MALSAFPLTTPNLFTVVRNTKLTNGGFFAAHDAALNVSYAMADASFYDFQIFKGSWHKDFTAVATAASSATTLRAVANGQVYGLHTFGAKWEGEVIDEGTREAGDPASKPNSRYFGKWIGRTDQAFAMGKGDPWSAVTTPGNLYNALGSLLPIIQGGVPFGATTVTTGSKVTQIGSPTLATTWLGFTPTKGKVIYGIHRASRIIFFLAQQDSVLPGIKVGPLITLLAGHGVDDAAMGDGSDSATLVVDGVVEVTPGGGKDWTIPVGVALRRQSLEIAAGGLVFNTCTEPKLLAQLGGVLPYTISNPSITFSWEASGPSMKVNSFGSGLTAAAFGLSSFPVTLSLVTGTDPAGTIVLQDPGGKLKLSCYIRIRHPLDAGTVEGYLDCTPTPTTAARAAVDWTIT